MIGGEHAKSCHRYRRNLHRSRVCHPGREVGTAKSHTTPGAVRKGRDGCDRGQPHRPQRVRLLRARDDGRHQRDHRAEGRQGGAAHHRGLPRYPGDRPRQPPRLLQPGIPQAQAVRAPLSAPRAAGAHQLQRHRDHAAGPVGPAGHPRRFPGRRGGGHRHLLHQLLRQPGPRGGGAGQGQGAVARGLRGGVAPDHPRVARVRAHQHGGAVRLCAAHRPPLPGPPDRPPDRGRHARARRTSCSPTAAWTRSRARARSPSP